MNRKPALHTVTGWWVTVLILTACTAGAQAQEAEEPQPAYSEPVDFDDLIQVDIPLDRLEWHLPSLEQVIAEDQRLLEEARAAKYEGDIKLYSRRLERFESIRRPRQVHLTLEDVLRLTLANSYDLQVQRFNPAIETTRIVEAEGTFDAVFFSSLNRTKQDQPTASELAPSTAQFISGDFGVRKLLPSGMTVSTAYEYNRSQLELEFQTLNPAWTSDAVLELNQPFLRGFGADYNRSLIVAARNNKAFSDLAFQNEVRDRLREVEELYWNLLIARNAVVVNARLLADFENIYDNLIARREFDITPVQIAATKADLESSKADFVQTRAAVFDAEDRLITVMNTDDLDLADNVELIPVDFPHTVPLIVDRLAEVQEALDHRREIKQQELSVANARIAVGQAKNEELPRFDAVFRYTINGLGQTWDDGTSQMLDHDYVDYFIGVQFEMPIGNRGPRAARKRADLQHLQARAALKAVLEGVILDVNLAVRAITTTYNRIGPRFESAEAREREVESIDARAERKDLNTLINELGARRSLANARLSLLQAMIDYNLAIVDLERVKGMLLRYNNVVIPDETASPLIGGDR